MLSSAFYIMGPSGSGKDSVIEAVTEYFQDHVSRPPRYITRAITNGDAEQHNVISDDVFNELLSKNCFSLSWEANGYRYAYDKQWLKDLAEEKIVLLNGSREYWSEAKTLFATQLIPIELDLDLDVQRARLENRGRESQAEIEERIERNQQLSIGMADDVVKLDANQPLVDVVNDLICLITQLKKGTSC